MATLGTVQQTDRGFEIVKFCDAYGNQSSLQQSSLAEYEAPGTSAIWLGCQDNRMHLRLEQVKALRDHLSAWIEYGRFSHD